MSQTRSRDEALAAMLADSLSEGRPAPELLIRYADDPAQLAGEERAHVEWHLANTPGCAAQLRLLRAADFEAPRRPASTPPGRLPRRAGWVAVGLAASVAALALVRMRDTGGAPPRVEVAVLPESHPRPDPARVSEPEPPSAEPAEPPRPIARAEAPTPALPPSEPRDAPAPADPEPPDPTPVAVALVLPQYRAPADAASRPRRASALRGRAGLPAIQALVPEHVARTARAAPTLLWHIDALPVEGSRLEFSVTAPSAPEPLIREVLPLPVAAGVQAIRLDARGVTLPLDVECRWAIALRADPDDPGSEVFAQGWVQRVALTGELETRFSALGAHEIPAAHAEAGLWYDALAELFELSSRSPDAAEAARALDALLGQAGLPAR